MPVTCYEPQRLCSHPARHHAAAIFALALLAMLIPRPAAAADKFPAWATVYSLVKDGNVMWAGTGMGIERIDMKTGGSVRIITNEAFENKARRFVATGDSVWIARKFDMVQCAGKKPACRPDDMRQRGEVMVDAAQDGSNVWLLLSERIMRYDPALRLWEEFFAFDPKNANHDFRAMASRGNLLWLGEAKGNICTLDKKTAALNCPLPAALIPYHAWQGPIVPAETSVWFFHENTLMAYNPQSNTVQTFHTPRKSNDPGLINSILPGDDGTVWYSSHRTIARFDPRTEKWDRSFTSSRGHSLTLAGRRKNELIVTSSHGLARFDPKRNALNYYNLPDVFNEGYQPLAAVLGNDIWMGFPSGKVLRFNPGLGNGVDQVVRPGSPAEILDKNFEGLEPSRMALPLALEHLATTQLEKHGARIWGASRMSLAMHDGAEAVWNVRFFPAAVRFFHFGDQFALATAGGKIYVCGTDDITCTPPRNTISTAGKTGHLPTALLRHRDELIMATREGRVLSYDLRRDKWSTLLDVPDRWRDLHPASAALAGKTVWIARDDQVFRYQFLFSKNKLEHMTRDAPLKGSEILRVCAPDDAHLAVITDTHAYLLTNKKRTETLLPSGSAGNFATPCIQKNKTLWLAVSSLQTAPGYVFGMDLAGGKITPYEIPDQTLSVYDVEPEGGVVWLGTSAGIFKFDTGAEKPALTPLGK